MNTIAYNGSHKEFVWCKRANVQKFIYEHITRYNPKVDLNDEFYLKITFLEGTGLIATHGELFGAGAQYDYT